MVNIPIAPGVPSIIGAIAEVVPLLVRDAVSLIAGSLKLPWGIYLDLVPVVVAQTVTAFGYDQKYQISTFPVEQGGFASYNKVYTPFEINLRFSSGEDLATRQALLNSIAAIIGDTNIYDVVTADAVYTGVNLTESRYRQTANEGLGLIQVDVTATQVRTIATSLLDAVLDFSSAGQLNGGPVVALAATAAQKTLLPLITGLF